MDSAEVIVVGAGIAGLACARELRQAGISTLVLEKSRGVGGRCATRRVDGQPVDHGTVFYHGSDPGFLAALREVEGRIEGWPDRVRGEGRACQPRAFKPNETRIAFADGVNAFPRHLAREIAIARETRVRSMVTEGDLVVLSDTEGTAHRAPAAVIALPAPQAVELLPSLQDESTLASCSALLRMVGSTSCLTVIAGYDADRPLPDWDLWYPEDSRVLQLVSHDSSKRHDPERLVIVYQALPAWSRENIDRPERSWSGTVLGDAERLVGNGAGSPAWVQAHRWRYARADHGSEFSRTLLYRLPGGARIGLAGESFAPGGGVEAAWRSGREIARRLIEGKEA